MAIRTREELLNAVSNIAGEEPSDEIISLLEDIGDTYDDLTSRFTPELDDDGNPIDWKQRYEDSNKEWRKRYVERFKTGAPGSDPEPTPGNDPAIFNPQAVDPELTYDNLFKEEK